jgi:hypothetical protein
VHIKYPLHSAANVMGFGLVLLCWHFCANGMYGLYEVSRVHLISRLEVQFTKARTVDEVQRARAYTQRRTETVIMLFKVHRTIEVASIGIFVCLLWRRQPSWAWSVSLVTLVIPLWIIVIGQLSFLEELATNLR